MTWKVSLELRSVRRFVNIDQIGMRLWLLAVLAIGCSLLIQLNTQSSFIDLMLLCVYLARLIGVALVLLGVLHILQAHYRALTARIHSHVRYARAALCPLWYYPYSAPLAHAVRAKARRTIRFDHGEACAWGLEGLLAAATLQAALELAAGQPIWRQAAALAVLAATYTTLSALRDHVAAHGHGSLMMRNA